MICCRNLLLYTQDNINMIRINRNLLEDWVQEYRRVDFHALSINPSQDAMILIEPFFEKNPHSTLLINICNNLYSGFLVEKYKTHILEILDTCKNLYILLGKTSHLDLIEQFLNRNSHKALVFQIHYWKLISSNPNAISLLKKHIDKINWEALSANPNAIDLLEAHFEKINWETLSINPSAIHLLEQNVDKIDWVRLSRNPNAIHLLKQYPEKIDYLMLFSNTNPNTIDLLKPYIETNIDDPNPDKILWHQISWNPNMIALLEKYPDKINWRFLYANPNATCLLKHINKYKYSHSMLYENPNIFKINYERIHTRCLIYKEELMIKMFHPNNIPKLHGWKIDGFESDSDSDE